LPPENITEETDFKSKDAPTTPWIHEGPCPTLKNTISQRDGFKLEH